MRGSAKRRPEARWPACSTGPFDVAKGILGEDAVKTEALDFEQSAIGGKADGAQFGEVMQAFADAEVVAVVDGGLGAQGALLLVILLDASVFVVDVERGGDALSEDAGSHPSRGSAGDAAIEDQLDLLGATEIEVLADHLLEEDAAVHRAIEYLGQGKFGLQD